MQADTNAPVFATGEVEVAADPDTVWAVMADIGRWPSWNPDIKAATVQGPVQPGSSFSWKAGPGTIRSTFQVVQRPTELSWTGRTMGIGAIHVYQLRASDQAARPHHRPAQGVLERPAGSAAAPTFHQDPADRDRHRPGPPQG